MVAIIRQPLAVRVLLTKLQPPAPPQLGRQRARTGKDRPGSRIRIISPRDQIERKPGRIPRIPQIAGFEALLHLGGILPQIMTALLVALHRFARSDTGLKHRPRRRRFFSGEPFIRRAPALFRVGAGETERLIDETIIAEPAPGQNMIDLDRIIPASQRHHRYLPIGIKAASVLFLPKLETQHLVGAIRRPPEQFGKIIALAVALLVALLDTTADFVAFLGTFANIAGELNMNTVRQPEFSDHDFDLLEHLTDRLARDRIPDILKPDFGTSRMIEPDLGAGF